MTKFIIIVASILLALYLFTVSALYFFQRSFLYAPTTNIAHDFERLTVLNQGENIDVIVLNKGNEQAIIYFGGNAEAVLNSADIYRKYFPDKTVYLVNYRGYGASSGSPSEQALYSDAIKIFETVEKSHSTIAVIGRSLGSGVATYLAINKPVNKIALITPYDSILSVAENRFKIFPVKYLLKDKFDSVSRAPKITTEVFIVAAEKDQVIPIKHTEKLAEGFNNKQLTYREIKDEGHNSISNSTEYYLALKEFLK